MFSKINNYFYTKSKHLKIKDKKNILTKLLFRQMYITRKFELQGCFVVKGSGSGSGILPDPDSGDPKRPEPDPQHAWI